MSRLQQPGERGQDVSRQWHGGCMWRPDGAEERGGVGA
jgi:hypothetical protein